MNLAALKTLLIVPRATKELSLQERYDRDPDSLNSKQMKRLLREWAEVSQIKEHFRNHMSIDTVARRTGKRRITSNESQMAPIHAHTNSLVGMPSPRRFWSTMTMSRWCRRLHVIRKPLS